MTVSRLRQSSIHTLGSSINDGLTPSDHDANAVDLEDTLNYYASQLNDIVGKTNWEDAPDASIATIWGKTFLDEKLALRERWLITDTTVPNGQNYKVLVVASSELPSTPIKAIALTQRGLVTAEHGGSFGSSHSLAEVTGVNSIDPQNLLAVCDGDTGDPILDSNDKQIWGLLQHESGATDGTAFTDTTPQRAQVSFVVINSTNDDLIACSVADIEDHKVNLAFVGREDLDTWVAQDFLRRSSLADVPSGSGQVTLDNAIDNQATTPATQTTNIFVRIDDDVAWNFADSTGGTNILKIAPAAAGDEVEVNADTLDVNVGASGTIDFDNGVTVDSGGTAINLGTTAGQIDASAIKVAATSGLAEVEGTGVTIDGSAGAGGAITVDGTVLDADFTGDADSHIIHTANSASDRTLNIASRNSGAGAADLELEADDDVLFEDARETTPLPLTDATAGSISGLTGGPHASVSAAIKYAIEHGGVDFTFDIWEAGSNYAKGVNIPAVTFDLTAYDEDMGTPGSPGTPDLLLFLNGRLMRGASGTGIGDWYAGTTPASGDIKVDFPKGIKTGDLILSVGLLQ